MSLRAKMWIVALVLYAFLWVLAANGVTSLIAPLTIPAVLAVLVYLGLALNKYLGITPKRPKFDDHHDDTPR
jgi:hypothetical protein